MKKALLWFKIRIAKIIIALAERILRFPIGNEFVKYSFSQDGEDLVLLSFLENMNEPGFFVDIGAHHPFRFSNTMLFYLRGWRGINIDATPGSMGLFQKHRGRDINIESAVSDKDELLTFYQFSEPAINSCDYDLSNKRNLETCPISSKVQIKAQNINSILEKNLPKNQSITFISIDVEGFDFRIIKSLDMNRFKPRYIIAEELDSSSNELKSYLASQNFELIAKTSRSLIFKSKH